MNNSISHQGEMDLGLRSFMLGTYKYMVAAMGVSGITGWLMSFLLLRNGVPTDLYHIMYGSPMRWALWLAPIIFIMVMGRKFESMSVPKARFILILYSALIGVWLADLGIYFTQSNPMLGAKILFMSATMFGAFSLFGYVTRKNLQGIGQFASMALIGVIITMVINIAVFKSTGFDTFISGIGLVVVAGMTAWQTQNLKQMYYSTQGRGDMAEKAAVFGAISLYISFINIFILLMRFMGGND